MALNMKQKLSEWFSATWLQVTAAVTAVIAGVVAAAVSPLPDLVSSWIWRERIVINDEVELVQGIEKPLALILQDHSRGAGIPSGVLTLRRPVDRSVEILGPARFRYPESSGSLEIAPEGLRIIGNKPGRHVITTDVRTDRGRSFAGEINVHVVPFVPKISTANVSGDWIFRMNRQRGTMRLEQPTNDRKFYGTAKWNGREYRVTDGYWDGTTFNLTMEDGGSQIHEITGLYCHMPGDNPKFWVVNARVTTKGVGETSNVLSNGLVERCSEAEVVKTFSGTGFFDANAQIVN